MADIHSQLLADCSCLGRYDLCHLLLMNDAHYPWFILVPDRDGASEIIDLAEADRQQLLRESCDLAQSLKAAYKPDKLNIAALGNIVPQLHVHHIVRYRQDAAWPAPVWGQLPACAYSADERAAVLAQLLPLLGQSFCPR